MWQCPAGLGLKELWQVPGWALSATWFWTANHQANTVFLTHAPSLTLVSYVPGGQSTRERSNLFPKP